MKDVRFIWGLPQEDSFIKLKELITSAPILVLPNDNIPFRLETDSSGIATGVVLSQQQVDDNMWHPVAFLSKALNPLFKVVDSDQKQWSLGVYSVFWAERVTPCKCMGL
jgi:hypothetical protein